MNITATPAQVSLAIQRNVRRLRLAAGLPAYKLSTQAGLAPNYVGRLETMMHKAPTIKALCALASVLGVGIADLVAEPK